MVKALIYLLMGIHILDNINMASLTGSVNINGKMVVYMLVNLEMGKNMEKANGRNKQIRLTVTHMKVSIFKIRKTVMVYFNGKVVIYTKEIIKMMKEMDMEKCTGQMAQSIKDNGSRAFNMEKVK
jgi:hypothetical protein